jgi:hypothetical protein
VARAASAGQLERIVRGYRTGLAVEQDAERQWDPCPDTGARLPRRYLGWFVKVADIRYARIPIFADRLYTSPEALTPFTPDGRTAVASVGRIRPGRGPAGPC